MGPSDVHGQTAGAWKESWMAQAPGGPLRPLPPGASNGADVKRGLRSYPARPELHGDLPGAGWIKSAAVIEKSPGAGAERQPLGRATAPEDRKILVEDRKVLLVAE